MLIQTEFKIEEGSKAQNLRQEWWSWKEQIAFTVSLIDKDYNYISCARLFNKKIIFNNLIEINAVGIGGVYTLPDKRGMGYATLLLKSTIDYLEKNNNYLAALLFAKQRFLYKNLGFHIINEGSILNQLLWLR